MSVQSRRTDLSHGLDGVVAVDVVHVHREGGGGELAHAIMSSYQNQITSVKTLLTGLIKKGKKMETKWKHTTACTCRTARRRA